MEVSDPLDLPPLPPPQQLEDDEVEERYESGGGIETESSHSETGAERKDKSKKKKESSKSSASNDVSLRKIIENFQLPEGWVVEKRVRASGPRKGIIDKYYHDPNGKVKTNLLSNF